MHAHMHALVSSVSAFIIKNKEHDPSLYMYNYVQKI